MDNKQYDGVGNAKHYNEDRIPGMFLLEQTYGTLGLMYFCEISAMKYRIRIGRKAGQPIEQELTKIAWYEDAAKYYKTKLETEKGVLGYVGNEPKLPWEVKDDITSLPKDKYLILTLNGGERFAIYSNNEWVSLNGIELKVVEPCLWREAVPSDVLSFLDNWFIGPIPKFNAVKILLKSNTSYSVRFNTNTKMFNTTQDNLEFGPDFLKNNVSKWCFIS